MAQSIKEIAGDKYVLWGANWSLYTAVLRPYLIKKGIEYVEINPNHPEYSARVVPHIGYVTHPILETPEGEIIADSTIAIDFLEPHFTDLPMLPEDKSLAALARLIQAYGMEGLQKQAMYWRWNSTFESRLWAREEFRSQHTRAEWLAGKREKADAFAEAMRGYLPILGITLSHDVDVAIETSTVKLYDVLNAHFLEYPYLLGGTVVGGLRNDGDFVCPPWSGHSSRSQDKIHSARPVSLDRNHGAQAHRGPGDLACAAGVLRY